ncbi:hypothetical protein DIU31_015210 [Mucilaginibacter rubeus]|uniref:Uncharacterized protein n=1 Tax=Mucilaginibacter rubeus TaxID=2027860 RepID=A0AAE6JFW8_9SPHI|nr:hypothetical protein DIU31_015210 [Mucilaginibacter rubeus]QEM17390.1 hypothetical protein DIU38_015370 [Mucilaginibacter gossypii]
MIYSVIPIIRLNNLLQLISRIDESLNYASLTDDVITPQIKDDAIKTKGYKCASRCFLYKTSSDHHPG